MHTDRLIAELAATQHGVVGARQIAGLGLGERGVRHRVASGSLHRLHPGAYAVGHASVSIDGRRLAAVLASGDGAVLSRFSAASAWGILNDDGRRFDVVAPGRSGGRVADPAQIDLRRTRRLMAEDVTSVRGIPITTIGRTLLDLAGCAPRQVVARAVHEAEISRLLDVELVLATIERNPGRRGVALLRRAVAEGEAAPTGGRIAEVFVELCDAHGLPRPLLGVHVDGGDRLYETDALFGAERLIVELDGQRVHDTARNFQTDRRRDSVLAARDYVTLRYTWRRLLDEPEAVAAELRRVLALRTLRAA